MKIEGLGTELGIINTLVIIAFLIVLKWGWPWTWFKKSNPGGKTTFGKNSAFTLVKLKQAFDDCKTNRSKEIGEVKDSVEKVEERLGKVEQGIARIEGRLGKP